MKKIIKLLAYISILLLYSCNGMLDNIEGYLNEGETVYVGKIDSVKSLPGKNRIQIVGVLQYGITQTNCIIMWKAPNGQVDSLNVPIERINQVDKFSVILDNMNEGQYDFTLVTEDSQKNKSLPTTTQGYCYGDFYQQSLLNRGVAQIAGRTIEWRSMNEEDAIFTEVLYEKEDGTTGIIIVDISDSKTYLSECSPNGRISWRTSYIPEPNAIDTFYTEYETLNAPDNFVQELDKSMFKEVKLPTDANMGHWGFSLSHIWNGNTTWGASNMCHSETSEGWPQWFTFDLGVVANLKEFRYWQRLQEEYLYERGGGNLKKWELYGCADTPPSDGSWDGWIKLMDCESIKPSGVFDSSLTNEDIEYAKAGELFVFPENTPPVRYIRWKGIETFSGVHQIHFQQVTFWGEVVN